MQSTDCVTPDRPAQQNHPHRRSLPASFSSTPRHSSPLNPASVLGATGGRDERHGHGHRHSTSLCASSVSSSNSPLSLASTGHESGNVPGADQLVPTLGSPFKPSPDKASRGRGLSLSITPARPSDSSTSTLSTLSTKSSPVRSPPTQTPSLLSPSATLRPDALTDTSVNSPRARARSGSAPKSLAGNLSGPSGIPPTLAPTASRASFWRRDEDKLLSPSSSSHSRPWHTMFDMSASAKDKPRRHSIATGTPTKECKDAETPAVPAEQMENWDITRKRVAQATSSILGTTALIAHEVLLTSVDLFELAPVPGLQAAARTLLQIWDCLQQVDSNRLQCLRLTEHCADILLSVRQEVYEAGDEVEDELRLPFDKLTESFNDVHALLVKQAGRPFLKRYLKRDEISKQLHHCDVGLQEALGMFSISIQIRILKQVQLAEARRQHDTQELLRGVANLSHLSQHGYSIQSDPPSYSTSTTPDVPAEQGAEPPKISQMSGQSPLTLLPSHNGQSKSPRPPFPYATSSLLMLSQSKAVSTSVSASGSSQSLMPGLHGLPASSSHSSLSQSSQSASLEHSKNQSLETYSWNYSSDIHTLTTDGSFPSVNSAQVPLSKPPQVSVSPKDTSNVIPSVSITPSSRPSTATSSSTASADPGDSKHVVNCDVPEAALQTRPSQISKFMLPQPPIQLIPTKSSIDAAGAVLEAIQRQGKISAGYDQVEVSNFESSSASTSTSTVTAGVNSADIGPATSRTASTTTSHATTLPIPPALLPSASSLPPTQVLPTLLSLTRHQAALDAESDYADLRGVMRAALSKGSDVEMMKVLGVGLRKGGLGRGSVGQLEGLNRGKSGFGEEESGMESLESGGLDAGEIAEAIKTLQRAHEAILERERWEDLRARQQPQESGDVSGLTPAQLSHVSQITSQQSLKTQFQELQCEQQKDYTPQFDHLSSSSSSSMKMFAGIKRRMSLQSSRSYSSTTASLLLPTSLNETTIHEEGEVGDADVRRKGEKSEGGRPRSKRGKVVGVGARLMRSKTVSSSSTSSTVTTDDSIWSRSESGSGSGVSESSAGTMAGKYIREKDTLDKEFIESGIDALRRMSRSTAVHRRTKTRNCEDAEDPARLLPSWTITRYEIDREEKIGVGFFSDVYKGTWRPPSVPSAPSYPYSAINGHDTSPSISRSPYSSRIVAIKVLAETTPRSLFLRETAIWKKLSHLNVLELYGASSAFGDPPWFFVSPYMKNGSLAEYLRRSSTSIPDALSGEGHVKVPWGLILPGNSAYGIYQATGAGKNLQRYAARNGGGLGSLVGSHVHTLAMHPSAAEVIGLGLNVETSIVNPFDSLCSTSPYNGGFESVGVTFGNENAGHTGLGIGNVPKEWDLLRFMHEIAEGMEYLHSQGVLHGDLKASNVLVDDKIHCVISDFGQSEMRSEAYRISGTAPPHGTLRWQAPEILAGSSQLTVEMDVYAFAVCCTEILSLGRMPWPLYDDYQVQSHIMAHQRPGVPPTCFTTPNLNELIQSCWATDPLSRPPFSKVATELKALRKEFTISLDHTGALSIDSDLKSPQFQGRDELTRHLQHQRLLPSPDMHPIELPQRGTMNTPPGDIQALCAFMHETPSPSYSNLYTKASSLEGKSSRISSNILTSPHGVEVKGYSENVVSTSTSAASTITDKIATSNSSPYFPFVPPGSLPFSPITASTPSSAGPSPLPPVLIPYPPSTRDSLSLQPRDYITVDMTRTDNNNSDAKDSHVGSLSATPAQSRIPNTVTPSQPPSSPTSSIFASSLSESSSEGYSYNGNTRVPGEELATENKKLDEYDGYASPLPANDLIAEARNERRYRLLLVHGFHPSLTLPLWSPAPVALGAVGYLSKPRGEFITLFNAFHPQNSVIALVKGLPSVHGYGKFSTGSQRQDKRNAAQRSLDAIAGLLTLKGRGGNNSKSVSRRYSYPLRAGHKTAHMCTETTMYRYVENLEAPKKWFKANVDTVLKVFGPQHQIQKEDLFFVIGTLDTPEYALFVSHNHPDGQVHFNVFTSAKSRQPWGTFSTDTESPFDLVGPSYHEPVSGSPISAHKISPQGSSTWNTVLIARLRFKPDVLEPTSL